MRLEEREWARAQRHSDAGGDLCTFGEDGLCEECGVSGDACPAVPSCGGRGYHRAGCGDVLEATVNASGCPYHGDEARPDTCGWCAESPYREARADERAQRATVKRGRLWGEPEETYQTEGELNGWRASQGRLM